MMNVKKNIITLHLLLMCLILHAQQSSQSISGRIVDESTGSPVPFVSIGIMNSTQGTSSNEEGEFLLKTDSMPVRIVFSHLNYQKRLIEVKSGGNMGDVALIPVPNTLDELTISDKRKGNEATRLLLRAYEKTFSQTGKEYYGKAFFRQKTKENKDDFYELYEIFYDAKFSVNGISDWAIQEGRYALNERPGSNYLYNRNFTLFGRLLTMIQPNTDDYIMPVNPMVEDLYEVTIIKLLKMGDREVAVINCQIIDEVKIPALNGNVYIDINSYDILKLEGSIENDNLGLVKLTQSGQWRNYVLDYEIAFKPDIDSALLLDYIRVSQSFDYSKNDNMEVTQPVNTEAILTFYDYYTPAKSKRLGGRMNQRASDADLLNQIGYNKEFWDDNPVVKRTPVEEEVIRAFESQSAFGTIYLNDKELIVLEKDNLEENPVILKLISGLKTNVVLLDQEKAFLHFDKDFYTPGEVIWFKAYLIEALRHRLFKLPSVLNVELYGPDQSMVQSARVKIDQGWGSGQFELPPGLETGNYLVRAYTPWMRNFNEDFFFNRVIPVYGSTDDNLVDSDQQESGTDIQFFPEGGHFVAGLIGQVAFKAVVSGGKGIEVSGKIINSKGDTLTGFKSNHLGMGSVYLMPQPGDQLHAVIDGDFSHKKYFFPEIQPTGISISVRYLNSKTIKVALRATPDFNGREFYMLGQSKGVIYHKEMGVITKGQAVMEIPEAKFPGGILQLTVFNTSGQPLLERLVFITTEQEGLIHVEVSNKEPDPREKSTIGIEVTNKFGRALKSELSVSITDYDQTAKDPYGGNIRNYLMLRSELKGLIEQPGYYFKDTERSTLQDLDVLMLTQGWRRFSWENIIEGKRLPIQYRRGTEFMVSGVVVDKATGNALPNHSVTIFSEDFFQPFRTDDKGKFLFYNEAIQDSLNVLYTVENSGGRAVNALIRLDNKEYHPLVDTTFTQLPSPAISKGILDYLDADELRRQISESYGDPVYLLPEMVVEGKPKVLNRESNPYESLLYTEADVTIEMDDAIRSLPNIYQVLMGRAPGVRVNGTNISIRGATGDPLVLVNGMAINSFRGEMLGQGDFGIPSELTAEDIAAEDAIASVNPLSGVGSSGTSLASQLGMIDVTDIERIDVITSASTALFGSRGGNGVIAIYTRNSVSDIYGRDKESVNQMLIRGYDAPVAFYEPKYEGQSVNDPKPDHRVTLAWKPHLVTDESGKVLFSFYNSDSAKDFEIVIEGIAEDGTPLSFIYNTTN